MSKHVFDFFPKKSKNIFFIYIYIKLTGKPRNSRKTKTFEKIRDTGHFRVPGNLRKSGGSRKKHIGKFGSTNKIWGSKKFIDQETQEKQDVGKSRKYAEIWGHPEIREK